MMVGIFWGWWRNRELRFVSLLVSGLVLGVAMAAVEGSTIECATGFAGAAGYVVTGLRIGFIQALWYWVSWVIFLVFGMLLPALLGGLAGSGP